MSDLRAPAMITAAGEQPPPSGEHAGIGQAVPLVAVSAETSAAAARELISRRAFGRRRGWAPSYVITLARRGVLTMFAQCAACRHLVSRREQACSSCGTTTAACDWSRARLDPDLAAAELARARDPTRDATRARWARRRALLHAGRLDELADDNADLERATFAQARAALERTKVQLMQLQLDERRRNLVRAEHVRTAARRVENTLLLALLAIPARVCHQVAAEQDAARILILLEDAFASTLAAVAQQFSEEAAAVSAETGSGALVAGCDSAARDDGDTPHTNTAALRPR